MLALIFLDEIWSSKSLNPISSYTSSKAPISRSFCNGSYKIPSSWIPSWMILSHLDRSHANRALKCFVNTLTIQILCAALRTGPSFTFPTNSLLASALQQQRCPQLPSFCKAHGAGCFLMGTQICFLDVAWVKLQQGTRRINQVDMTACQHCCR